MCVMQVVLDEAGAAPGCSTLDSEGELVVGRPEAVYFYSPDGRGPCFVFEGDLLKLITHCRLAYWKNKSLYARALAASMHCW